MSNDSLKSRYFYKLSTNIIGLLFNVVAQAIIPRGLGPKTYGDFNFLTNFFNQVVTFLDMGTSIGFYTKLSQRPKELGLVSFYFYFMGIVSAGVLGFVAITVVTSINTSIWIEQEVLYIYMAAIWGILMWFSQILNQMIDGYGLTVSGEKTKILQKALGLILILLLYGFHQLNLINFFYYNYIILLVLAGAFIWIMQHNGYLIKDVWRLSWEQIKRYLKEFYQYSHPLFSYAVVGLVVGIFDRWLLQVYSGSIQQGFYSFSYQIGAICFLFTSAMTPLLIREFSIAYGQQDLSEMARLFRRYIPLLYSIAAYFSCFIAVQSDKVVYIFGGDKFKESAGVLTIMAFYPIHQTYGQLSGSVFYATGQTALYRNIGVIFMLLGLPVTYFLIAPPDNMGLNMGATGLAVKMVVLQFIGVNVQLYFNARLLKLSFGRYLGHQIASTGCFLILSTVAVFIVNNLQAINKNILVSFLSAGFLYTLTVAAMAYYKPVIFGLKKEDIKSFVNKLKGF
ncbi:polysaccharide biosynthesis protein [hot springs metagenome]|uniref:Polysaccharide biosynthesis protein n=1 Tax=hot springs metagenome TaxID=433727 RepID=A0A5J4KZC7_9ZZZZ